MLLRMMRNYSDIALAHAGEKIVQYLLYIGKAPMTMADHVSDDGWQYRYRVLDTRDQDSEHFLNSDNPDALVLAILCDPKSLEPNALVAHIIKELRRLHGDKLDNLRDSLKMLDVLSGNRGLQEQNTLFLYTPSSYAKLSPSETILVGFMFHRGACY